MSAPAVVDAQWLHANQKRVKVVCVFSGMGAKPDWKEFKEKFYGKFDEHILQKESDCPSNLIPNSLFFHNEIALFPGEFQRLSLYPSEIFQEYVQLLGINEGDHIILYGNGPAAGMLFAARAWWTFKVYGHHNVSVLNGGFEAWKNGGFPIESTLAYVPKGNWRAQSIDYSLLINYESLAAKDSEGKALFDKLDTINYLDARPEEQYHGEPPLMFPSPEATGAHIRGSKHVPLVRIMTPMGIKSKEEIEKVLSSVGLKEDEPIVTSCLTGTQASLLSLGLFLCGHRFRLFNGSILEVGARGSHFINEK